MQAQRFSKGFTWGVATSAYQIDGNWQMDGKGESIWDRFAHTPGKIADGSNGDVACDHFRRWREDISLMRDLGINAYRFSISWPRIFPTGRGKLNFAGLDFYEQLVDGLLDAQIIPFITLYHWELPQALQDEGGWPSRSTAAAFVEFTDVVTRRLGDRVFHWITINEPWVVSILGHVTGDMAPGMSNLYAGLRAAHHLLLAHGWTVPVIRENSPSSEVGITLNLEAITPETDSQADLTAARLLDGHINRWYLDPLFGRGYPQDMVLDYARKGGLPGGLEFIQPGDMENIAVPCDFIGVNYYKRTIARSSTPEHLPVAVPTLSPDENHTEMGWEIYPQGLAEILIRLSREYAAPKIYITENGASYSDSPDVHGKVDDQRRISYIRTHLLAVLQAIESDAPVAGYFYWSLMDNFEWAYGYTQRFGLLWVDFITLQRIPKASFFWYRQLIAENGASLMG